MLLRGITLNTMKNNTVTDYKVQSAALPALAFLGYVRIVRSLGCKLGRCILHLIMRSFIFILYERSC